MTKAEFATVVAYLEAACSKPIYVPQAGETAEMIRTQTDYRIRVYYDLLGDLTLDALQAGAKRVVLEHPWATFPSVAELRAAAVQAAKGAVTELTAGQAWELAWKAVGRIDMEIPHTIEPALAGLPKSVRRAMDAYGLTSLVYGKEPLTVVRAQFERFFNDLAEADARRALLPASLVQQIEQQGKPALSGPLAEAIERIGKEPQ